MIVKIWVNSAWLEIPVGESDHGALLGKDDDDHPQYVLADGTRPFTDTQTGVDPVLDQDLVTKIYLDSYTLADGTRPFLGTQAGIDPVADQDLVTKIYVDNATAGGGLLSSRYRYDSTITEADPGAGDVRFNHGTLASVTEVYISDITDTGVDADAILGELAIGDHLYFQETAASANRIRVEVDSGITDNAGWRKIPVTVVNSSGTLTNNVKLTAIVLLGAAGGGGTVDFVSNVATARLLGRITAGPGDSEELTAAQAHTLLNITDGANVNVTTDLTTTQTTTTVDVVSSDGTDATLPQAIAGGNAGVLAGADQTKLNNTTGTNSGDESAASDSAAGIVELATTGEVITGTSTTLAVTPAGLAGNTKLTLVDGTRAFTGTVSGITPTVAANLVTKGYVDGEVDTLNGRIPMTMTGQRAGAVPNAATRRMMLAQLFNSDGVIALPDGDTIKVLGITGSFMNDTSKTTGTWTVGAGISAFKTSDTTVVSYEAVSMTPSASGTLTKFPIFATGSYKAPLVTYENTTGEDLYMNVYIENSSSDAKVIPATSPYQWVSVTYVIETL